MIATLDELADGPAALADLFNAWADGDAAAIDREINGRLRDEMPTLYDILIVERNTAWTERLEQVMDEPGVVMVVVGAGHLAGADGVPTMLAARGYAVEQVSTQP